MLNTTQKKNTHINVKHNTEEKTHPYILSTTQKKNTHINVKHNTEEKHTHKC